MASATDVWRKIREGDLDKAIELAVNVPREQMRRFVEILLAHGNEIGAALVALVSCVQDLIDRVFSLLSEAKARIVSEIWLGELEEDLAHALA